MRRLTYALLLPAVVAVGLVVAAPAAADEPTIERSTVTLGPFVDDETCTFPFSVTVERTRTTIYYANGDIKRHTDLIVTSSANGKTEVQRNSFNVFIDGDAPTAWVITGVLEKAQLHGRTLWLESGRLVYDLETDEVSDSHPGPLAEPPMSANCSHRSQLRERRAAFSTDVAPTRLPRRDRDRASRGAPQHHPRLHAHGRARGTPPARTRRHTRAGRPITVFDFIRSAAAHSEREHRLALVRRMRSDIPEPGGEP